MYDHNADNVHAMCGMVPLDPQDAPAIAAVVREMWRKYEDSRTHEASAPAEAIRRALR